MFLSDLQTNITKKLFDSGIETSSLDSRIILKEIFCFDEKELILNSKLIVPNNKINEVDMKKIGSLNIRQDGFMR